MSEQGAIGVAPLRMHQRRACSFTHLSALFLAACYLMWVYPAAQGPVLVLLLGGIVAEACPYSWRRWFVAEGLLLITGVIAYLWTRSSDGLVPRPDLLATELAFHGWIRMVLAFWALVPSRLGMLRIFAILLVAELLLISTQDGFAQAASLALVPGALGALAADAWLRGLHRSGDGVAVGRTSRGNPLIGILPMSLLIGIPAVFTGDGVLALREAQQQQLNQQVRPFGENGQDGNRNLSSSLDIGDHRWVDQNPGISARLLFDGPTISGTAYLRAVTVPDLQLVENRVSWTSAEQVSARLPEKAPLHQGHETRWAWLYRERGSSDIVLRPDHAGAVELLDLTTDDDGNLYRRGLGERDTRYRVDLGAAAAPRPHYELTSTDRYRSLPDGLRLLLAGRIPNLEAWRAMPPDQAAASIRDWLASRCTYTIRDLPEAAAGSAGTIRTFLFGETADRRGHCQYFATAGVLLMRTAGHGARPVIGYASDEIDQDGVTFRALHAHAWAEFLTRDGWWQRIDFTPPSYQAMRNAGVDLADEPFDVDVPAADETVEKADENEGAWPWWWYAIAGAVPPAVILLILLSRRLKCSQDPVERRLQRNADRLVRLAMECGIRVDPHTTITSIVSALEERTDVDLQDHLAAHLAARFGAGPLPPPWPEHACRKGWATYRETNSTKGRGKARGEESRKSPTN
jgi:transglutaminase-like putative cysteine protease